MYDYNGTIKIKMEVDKKDYEKVLDILLRAFIFHNSDTDEEKDNGVIRLTIEEYVNTNHFALYVIERLYKDLTNVQSVLIQSFRAETVGECLDMGKYLETKYYKVDNGKIIEIKHKGL